MDKWDRTCVGESLVPHSCTSFMNMLYGPHFSTFLSRPKTESSSYVIPMSAYITRESAFVIDQETVHAARV